VAEAVGVDRGERRRDTGKIGGAHDDALHPGSGRVADLEVASAERVDELRRSIGIRAERDLFDRPVRRRWRGTSKELTRRR
jgi:hypothetical protein